MRKVGCVGVLSTSACISLKSTSWKMQHPKIDSSSFCEHLTQEQGMKGCYDAILTHGFFGHYTVEYPRLQTGLQPGMLLSVLLGLHA